MVVNKLKKGMVTKSLKWHSLFNTWEKPLIKLLNSVYMDKLISYIDSIYKSKRVVYPAQGDVFKAFKLCNWDELKVVIVGQDPYHNGDATGLAFANYDNVHNMAKPSPPLKAIEGALKETLDNVYALDYTLEEWAVQGVLLLNSSLTIEEGLPKSHAIYWKRFTETIIKTISEEKEGIIFLFWGSEPKKLSRLVGEGHYIFKNIHPDFGLKLTGKWDCNHFVGVNSILAEQKGIEECIKW